MRRARVLALLPWMAAVGAAPSAAAEAGAVTQPLFVEIPGLPEAPLAQQEFQAVTARYGLGPVEVVDLPAPPPPAAPAHLRAGIALVDQLKLVEAERELDAADEEVARTGGAGLLPSDLAELYLRRAWARHRATFGASGDIRPAWEDYLRAATLAPERSLSPHSFPRAVVEAWRRATAEVWKRPKGTIVVRAHAGGTVSLDARPAVGAPATFAGVVYGEHHLRVDEPGRPAWGAAVPLAAPTLEIDTPPRPPLDLDDATAAAEARRMGARFALVAIPVVGEEKPLLQMRLVDAAAARIDSTAVVLTAERGLLDAAVMRLDEEARTLAVDGSRAGAPPPPPAPPPMGGAVPAIPPPAPGVAPPPARVRLLPEPGPPKASWKDDPLAWSRDHWPLVAAVGVMIVLTAAFSLAVAGDDRP